MAGDFNKPATTDAYTAFASSVRDLAADLAKGLDPAVVSTTNIPTNTVRWTSASNKWQKYNGSTWVDLSSSYAINISGNAATATSATNAGAVPWSGVSSKPTTVGGYGITDLVASILASFRKDNWGTNGIVAAVSGLLAWKNYGNNHVIFDASAGTAPDGSAVNNTTSASVWSASYPTLMGWNGTSTYGVRVDSARWADSATTATTAGACTGNAATATTAAACSGNAATATASTTQTYGTSGTSIATTAFVDRLRDVPQQSKSASYTLALTDRGQSVDVVAGSGVVITIPANSSVAFPIGTVITVSNVTATPLSIAILTDTMRLAGTANTGTRTLNQYGVATMRKVAATTWLISGAGLL